jgi:SWI/SNF-related matrix-associated actin-dependent regulator of chromatin subfamily D
LFPEGNITEWRKQASSIDSDGVEIKRKGDINVNARIILVPDFNPQKYKVDDALANIISLKLATKPHIIMEVWNYIKVSIHLVYKNRNSNDETCSKTVYKMKRINVLSNATIN